MNHKAVVLQPTTYLMMRQVGTSTPVRKFDEEVDKHLWDWTLKQDQRTYEQFGLAIVGIGALFFAYGTVQVHDVQILIAFIGLAGSIILWDQMYGARQEFYRAMKLLKDSNPNFKSIMDGLDEWRDRGRLNRWLYQPANRLMIYFMALVSGAWASVIFSLFGVALRWILIFDSEAVTMIAILILVRKLEDRGHLKL